MQRKCLLQHRVFFSLNPRDDALQREKCRRPRLGAMHHQNTPT
jgi:hypothetical protein